MPRIKFREQVYSYCHRLLLKVSLEHSLKEQVVKKCIFLLRKIFLEFSPPEILHSDNGKDFGWKLYKIRVKNFLLGQYMDERSSQRPGSSGQTKQTIKTYITRKLCMDKEKKWRPVLPTIVPAYNRRVPDFIYISPVHFFVYI